MLSNMIYKLIHNKKIIYIIIGSIALLVAGAVVFHQTRNTSIFPKNQFGEVVKIKNINDFTKNLTGGTRDILFRSLFVTISLNTDIDNLDQAIQDALIRDGTFDQTHDDIQNVNKAKFIVDIPSLNQSYSVFFVWSDDKSAIQSYVGDIVTTKCLPVDQLIYGDFHCVDSFTQQTGNIPDDPIFQYLPQSTLTYTITSRMDSENRVILDINLIITDADRRIGEQAAIDQYKTEALDFIRSKGLDPDKYIINFTY